MAAEADGDDAAHGFRPVEIALAEAVIQRGARGPPRFGERRPGRRVGDVVVAGTPRRHRRDGRPGLLTAAAPLHDEVARVHLRGRRPGHEDGVDARGPRAEVHERHRDHRAGAHVRADIRGGVYGSGTALEVGGGGHHRGGRVEGRARGVEPEQRAEVVHAREGGRGRARGLEGGVGLLRDGADEVAGHDDVAVVEAIADDDVGGGGELLG